MAHRRRLATGKKLGAKGWEGLNFRLTGIDNADGSSALNGFSLAAGSPFTILRMRGQVMLQIDAAAVDDRISVAMGLILVPARAVAVGITAMPLPSTNIEDDWIWHSFLTVTSGAGAAIENSFSVDRVILDSKAMRKVKEDEDLVFVSEVGLGVDAGGTHDILGGVRVLIGF